MPQDEAEDLTRMIEDRTGSLKINGQHRGALIRLRSVLEEQLGIQPLTIVVSTSGKPGRELAG